MSFNYRKSVTYRLAQSAKASRGRANSHLGRLGLHAGQETVLKVLAESDGQTMSQLATTLGVQPPTVTKMISRLSAQGFVVRQASETDGRLARVFLTPFGREKLDDLDRAWKRLEKEALVGIDEKDRKRLRRLLRQVEKNLAAAGGLDIDPNDDIDLDDDTVPVATPSEGAAPAAEAAGSESVPAEAAAEPAPSAP
ncbi:MarR family transcriptional regulator [Pseudoxanthobacter sp.]|uniref:MarR family winged helix-turn-helix transcriptional regulator n=1 Tax=Pseudoxanthobacter sp. TaxID=1925742 RepID=UPI002FE08E57